MDILRVAAAFGIVCFHSRFEANEFREVFYAGLICFIIISVWFCMDREDRTPRQHFYGLTRVLAPWLFWSCVFLLRDAYIVGSVPLDSSLAIRLLSGTALHLWYVTFIVIVMTAIWWLRRHTSLRFLEITAWLGVFLLTAFADFWRAASMLLPPPSPQYAHALFPVFASIIIYCDFQRGRYFGIALTALAALFLGKFHGVGAPYLIGIALCVAAFGLAGHVRIRSRLWPVLADCMFGVYLIHPLLFYPYRKLVSGQTLAFPLLVFFTATAIVLLVRQFGNAPLRLLFGLRQ